MLIKQKLVELFIIRRFSNLGTKKKRNTKKYLQDSLYWIPEETHQLNDLDFEKIKVKMVIL